MGRMGGRDVKVGKLVKLMGQGVKVWEGDEDGNEEKKVRKRFWDMGYEEVNQTNLPQPVILSAPHMERWNERKSKFIRI